MSNNPLVLIQSTEEEDPDRGFSNIYLSELRKHFDLITCQQLYLDKSKAAVVKGIVMTPSKYSMIKPYLPLMTSLQVVSTISTGMDGLPVEELIRLGIKVGNTPCNKQQNKTIADFIVMLMLAVSKKLTTELGYMQGKVSFCLNRLGHDVTNKTLGIVGMGRIGSQLAIRAKAFDMNILYHNRNRRTDIDFAEYHDNLESMLPLCDYVAICCPHNEQSTKMFAERQFKMMKNTAIIINIARGKIIDTEALVQALKTGEIGGAGLDVIDPTPLPEGHSLFTMSNVILTPHSSSHTYEAKQEVWQMVLDNLKAGIIDNTELPYPVTTSRT